MEILILAVLLFVCRIAFALMGSPDDSQIDPAARSSRRLWRRIIVVVEILAGLAIVWEMGGI